MDIIYMSDAMAYQSVRGPIVNRYEYQWPNTYTSTQGKPGKTKKSTGLVEQHHANPGEKCQICKEKQRRGLGSYIRKKSTCQVKILEEEEEEPNKQQK